MTLVSENIKANRGQHTNRVINDAILVGRFLVERRQYGQSAAREKISALRLDENRNEDIMESVCSGAFRTYRLSRVDIRHIDLNRRLYDTSTAKNLTALNRIEDDDEREEKAEVSCHI